MKSICFGKYVQKVEKTSAYSKKKAAEAALWVGSDPSFF